VTVWITDAPSTPRWLAWYDRTDEGWPPYLGFDVRLRTGRQPVGEYDITIVLPGSYLDSYPDTIPPRVFREFIGGAPMEALIMYQELPSELDRDALLLRARVIAPPVQRGPRLYEILVVGCCEPSL
jgi:hypothetical protein